MVDNGAAGRVRADSPVVVVANRLPVDQVTEPDGGPRWEPSPGGLVTALQPIVAGRGAPGSAGPASAGRRARSRSSATACRCVPVGAERGRDRPLLRGLLQRHALAALPRRVATPTFHRRLVGRLRRRSTSDSPSGRAEVAADGAIVWVHDYHLQLVPAMLRALRPDAADRLLPAHPVPAARAVHPAAVAVGDHRRAARRRPGRLPAPGGARNFAHARPPAARAADARRADRASSTSGRDRAASARSRSRSTSASSTSSPGPAVRRRGAAEIRARLGNPEVILLGVDRLDYTKGIDVRLAAFRSCSPTALAPRRRRVLVQVATPTRERSSTTATSATRSSSSSARSTASYGPCSASRRSTTSTSRCRSRSSSRSTWPATSCW